MVQYLFQVLRQFRLSIEIDIRLHVG